MLLLLFFERAIDRFDFFLDREAIVLVPTIRSLTSNLEKHTL